MNDQGNPPNKPPQGPANGAPVLVGAEPVPARDPARLTHLRENRRLVVRRSLLSTALGGFIPLPVMDDFVAARVRAGLYVKLASTRNVDLPQAAADVLAEPRDGSTARNVTLTAATLIALKLAWRKFFALLAVGRGAEEMATTFQTATLIDHYCARMHVGGGVTRDQAAELRSVVHDTVAQTSKTTVVTAFREGGRVLARSALEAPRWFSQRLTAYAQRWASTGGNPAAAPFAGLADAAPDVEEAKWLDRATRAVEERLGTVGSDYLLTLIENFEERWRNRPPAPVSTPPGTSA